MKNIVVNDLNTADYQTIFDNMREFTKKRDKNTLDEIWVLEHFPVFTQGKAGSAEHILKKTDIPIIQSDRGGQITYHGPGQLIVYFLMDLKRREMHLRDIVDLIEQSVIELLKNYGIESHLIKNQPGVYVNNKKIASLGLRISRGCTYHGLSLNVDMDLTPFTYINPCGYKDLQMTQLKILNCHATMNDVKKKLLSTILGCVYNATEVCNR